MNLKIIIRKLWRQWLLRCSALLGCVICPLLKIQQRLDASVPSHPVQKRAARWDTTLTPTRALKTPAYSPEACPDLQQKQ